MAFWSETLADDPAIERGARQGGLILTEIDNKMYRDIQIPLGRLVAKATQLIGNETTNLAECWMHIRAKFDGGKVINRSQSGSWEHHCMGAGLQQNLGREWGPRVWREMTNSSPNKIFTDTARNSAKKVEIQRKRKATEEAKDQRRQSKYSRTDNSLAARKAYSRHDGDYTPDNVSDDVSPQFLDNSKEAFYNTNVVITKKDADDLEMKTRGQGNDELWRNERRKRLTASKVGSIAKMRQKTKRSKKVEEILYGKFKGNAATQYGLEMEETTKAEYTKQLKQTGNSTSTVKNCGLFVSLSEPWLAASPDGVVHDANNSSQPLGLVEIKNPYSIRDQSLVEASRSTTFCLEKNKDKNTYRLKRQHDYYYQVQCQLYCTERNWCDFVLRTNKDMHVERIYREKEWWDRQLPKLKKFYFESMLPELACPRYRLGGIRE